MKPKRAQSGKVLQNRTSKRSSEEAMEVFERNNLLANQDESCQGFTDTAVNDDQ